MSTELAVRNDATQIERVLIEGNLATLKPEERIGYYRMVCESVGLNPLTKPFEYITLNGKLTLYARKDATDQLRNIHNVSVNIVAREYVEGCYVVTSRAKLPNGREDESIGAVPIENLKGEARANAMMKCETKSKRRVTLSICGLGILDETEIETIPSAKPEVQRTTEDIPLTKSAASNSGQGVKTERSTQKAAPEAADILSTAAPTRGEDHLSTPVGLPATSPAVAPLPPLDDLVKQAEANLASKPGSLPEGHIEQGQAMNFEKLFKDNLKKPLQKQARDLSHAWLKRQGIVDGNGDPTAYAILKQNFYEVREAAIEHAKNLL